MLALYYELYNTKETNIAEMTLDKFVCNYIKTILTGHCGTYLKSQHSGGGGRSITSSKPAWAT
jgi:tRNA U54 and U55 pseudouridine synthase Pus10